MDIERIRSDFGITGTHVFLDNAGAVPLPAPVLEEMKGFIDRYYARHIMEHWPLLQNTVSDARALFARLIGAEPDEIALLGTTSEGLNIVANMVGLQPGDNVIINNLEFSSNVFPWLNLQRRGIEVRVARHRNGAIPVEDVVALMDERTRLVSTSHVAYLNGFRQDLRALGAETRRRGIYLVVDAAQSAGAVDIRVRELNVDFLACSAFKYLLGPSGTGAFYCRRELIKSFFPVYVSWMSVVDPICFEPGRPLELGDTATRFMLSPNINLIGFQGFRRGLRYVLEVGVAEIERRNKMLAERIVQRVRLWDQTLLSPADERSRSQIITFELPDVDTALKALRENNVFAVSRMGGLRLSPHFYNTVEEIDRALDIIGRSQGL